MPYGNSGSYVVVEQIEGAGWDVLASEACQVIDTTPDVGTLSILQKQEKASTIESSAFGARPAKSGLTDEGNQPSRETAPVADIV